MSVKDTDTISKTLTSFACGRCVQNTSGTESKLSCLTVRDCTRGSLARVTNRKIEDHGSRI